MSNSSNSSTSTPDLFYQKYHGTGFSLSLVWFFLPSVTVATIGTIFNGTLLWMLWKCSASMKSASTFHYLIGLETAGSLIYTAASPLMFLIVLSGMNYIRAESCFYFAIFPFFGTAIQHLTMVYISIERFLCVFCPIWYKNFSNRRKRNALLSILTMISVGWAIAKSIILYIGLNGELAGRDLSCISNDYLPSWWKPIGANSMLAFQIITVFFYLCVWIVMAKGAITKTNVANSHNMHILKALGVIMAIIIFGWMQYALSQFYLPILKLKSEDMPYFSTLLQSVTLFSSATNGPVLYMFSEEYRRHFKKTFPRILDGHSSNNAVVSIQGAQQQQQQQQQQQGCC